MPARDSVILMKDSNEGMWVVLCHHLELSKTEWGELLYPSPVLLSYTLSSILSSIITFILN